jgi:hypothetical protein
MTEWCARREEIKRTRADIARIEELRPVMQPEAKERAIQTLAYLNAKLLLMLSDQDPPSRRRRRKPV